MVSLAMGLAMGLAPPTLKPGGGAGGRGGEGPGRRACCVTGARVGIVPLTAE